MIRLKTIEEIKVLRDGGKILFDIMMRLGDMVKPGVSTWDLDKAAEKLIYESGGLPAFKNYGQPPFPGTLCTSLNAEVVHGIPNQKTVLEEGDIISLDIGMKYPSDNGMYTDMARTFTVGLVDADSVRLIEVSRKALEIIESRVAPGVDWHDIAKEVQRFIESSGFGVVRSLVGHGVGHEVHEEPQLPNYVIPNYHLILKEGMVLAAEPMITAGHFNITTLDDNWTVRTSDNRRASHWEDTFAVTKNGCKIITAE
ncbi:type I methionyl aminopeptidase [Candidatus Falkowbacteria bacterium CG10_big_fil_rev_8_21_14_0_10_39_11]|uniref:Methionine aminopeptidase n=1 Tax=Candidatus Falkowbacteria bacterium CG10_big_fil_rev_8_21_14_0_10_39_11 TaxID=1974565 RepID=A0A2H0V6D0_9BACT|nr:MAG: type I methionyl aminopeptidase [Candidatus Falkowbacteria bacterium CG10_big_fil_rev_8_21_14_0_10_39_11]